MGIKYRTSQRLTLSMRRSRAKKIVQEMEAAPVTGKQVQNKLETLAIPRCLEQRRKKIQEMEAPPATGKEVQNKLETTAVTSSVRRPRAKKKYLRWKLQVTVCSSNFWCVETWSKERSCSSTVKQAQNMLKTSEVVMKEG